MNSWSLKWTLDGDNSEENPVKLQKVFDIMEKNFYHLVKCMEVSRNALTECSNAIEDLRSEMVQLKCIVDKISSNNKQQSSDVSKPVKERNHLKKISEQEIIEEITVEASENPDDSSNSFRTKNHVDRKKRQRTEDDDDDDDDDREVYIIHQQKNDKSTPGPSRENPKISKTVFCHRQPTKEGETVDITEAPHSSVDAVVTALKNTNGVLSAEELNTFLYLADTVQDPVQLAKVSFTKDLKMLYYQLMTFHFHLKIANDVAEKEKRNSSANRELENKAQRLVHVFQAEVEQKDTQNK